MEDFTILVSQNGWEYTGYVYIEASSITVNGTKAYITRGDDAFTIEFDEEIKLEE